MFEVERKKALVTNLGCRYRYSGPGCEVHLLLSEDAWLSDILDFGCGSIRNFNISGPLMRQRFLAKLLFDDVISDSFRKFRFLTLRIPMLFHEVGVAALDSGFCNIEVLYSLRTKLERQDLENDFLASGLVFDLIEDSEIDYLAGVASNLFLDSRLFRDFNISDDDARLVRYQWFKDAVLDCDRSVYVARKCGKVIGFVVSSGQAVAEIELIGVLESYRNMGVGSFLLASEMNRLFDEGAGYLESSTQGTNFPALWMYEKFGFRLIKQYRTFHYHLCEGNKQ